METKWYWLIAWFVLGGIGVVVSYFYLRPHANPLSKNQYQEAEDEASQKRFSISISKRERLWLFLGTFAAALLFSYILISARDPILGFIFSVASFVLILLFPYGLMGLVPERFPYGTESLVVAIFWGIYLGVAFLGISTKNKRLFIILYLIFVSVLIMNVLGCVALNPPETFEFHD